MTAMRSATSTATRDVVRDEDHGQTELALQLAQQQQDLHLHGGIERGRRLVGEQDAAAGTTARARSWRAGACRPTSRADRRRAGAPGSGCARARTARAPACAPRRPVMLSCLRIASMICRPTVYTGSSASIGSWKIMDTVLPRKSLSASAAAAPSRRCRRRGCGPPRASSSRRMQAQHRPQRYALAGARIRRAVPPPRRGPA